MQPDAEVRKEFARDQVNFLRMKGINNGLRLSRIFKAVWPWASSRGMGAGELR